ncbi:MULTISPECIES: hypothetical protein [Sutcliffiella]|uniref:Uncharacterized protein n=1 Tax=Sutcliffiella cohnii TaxID=33932 RepID=A0A223KMG2_9BACI|nr:MULTISPECIES: hypothetical protein [Sutcliffiella]AST90652.1 hypothetical protein BC6307_04825 [Sutcliffiella cohnii]MED4016940.1 hypothetical protein [Sutcliffiella cohnii]WBL16304.1 hypothetical protein O1A01_06640 [Sutcliffiella sp. NC1]
MGFVHFERNIDFEDLYAERCGFKKKKKRDCICSIICDFVGETVTAVTKSGDMITGVVEHFDPRTGCVTFLIPAPMTPPMQPATQTIIGCDDIESISQEIPRTRR